MNLRFQWLGSEDGLCLLSEPYLSTFENDILDFNSIRRYPKLYFSYNASTQQTTIMTTDMNQLHLSMIHHLKQLAGMSIRLEEIAQLLIQCFVVIQEGYAATVSHWEIKAGGPVCCRKSPSIFLLDALTLPPNREWRHDPWTIVLIMMTVCGLPKQMSQL
jgi:hypothetical protein